MDCNFPELLAHDLDASNSVFSAKRLSAGAPSIFSVNAVQDLLPVDETGLHLIEPVPLCFDVEGYSPAPGPDIRYCPLSRQQAPLEPIDETPADRPNDDSTAVAHHVESDWDSLSSSSQQSSAMDLPITRLRDASVVTTATSLASRTMATGPAQKSGVPKFVPEVSWIDVDSDGEEPPIMESTRVDPAPPLRRRLGFTLETNTTPNQEIDADLDKAWDSITPIPARSPSRGDNYTLHSGRVSKRSPSRRRGMIRISTDQNFPFDLPASLQDEEASSMPTLTSPVPQSLSSSNPDSQHLDMPCDPPVDQNKVLDNSPLSSPLPASMRSRRTDTDGFPVFEGSRSKYSTDTHREPISPPRPSMPSNIQTWIDTSRDIATKPDDQLPGIPLPPDVVDNIRISISCFPDTMLLTSSLSVETIRSYSRKVKTCPADFKRDLSPPPPQHASPKKWGFSRILSSRRSNTSSGDRGSRDSTEEVPASPWTPLRAVFASGSEYLCDALYAHIVAYNYISALQRCAPTSPAKSNHRTADDGEVPRKAAALLGLHGEALSSEAKALPASRHCSPVEKRDNALRDLLVGLSKCIGRLVITLRDGSAEVVGEENGDVDLFLVRALCEVVRSSEER